MLYFITDKNNYQAGEWVDGELWLGTSTVQVNNLYGISFNINYDASLVQANTESITYSNSWLGNGTNAIKISKIDALTSTACGAKVRIDHINASGYGKIADFKFQIKNDVTPFSSLNLSITSYKAIDAVGNFHFFNTVPLTIGVAVGINELENINRISIYPNPSNGQFNFTGLEKENTIEIYDLTGRLIYQTTTRDHIQTIDLTAKAKGMYLYKVINELKGVQQGKIIIE